MLCKALLRASFLSAALPLVFFALSPPTARRPTPSRPTSRSSSSLSTTPRGGNWLADPTDDQPSGGLALALRDNNYYVSATNYGWGPDDIADRADIPNWPEWFAGPDSERYLKSLYAEGGQNVGGFGPWSRLSQGPGGENEIIMLSPASPARTSTATQAIPRPRSWGAISP